MGFLSGSNPIKPAGFYWVGPTSSNPGYNSVPDISITNYKNIKFQWNVGDDPMGSDHLPIVIHLFDKLIISSGLPLSNDVRSQKRPKFCLKNFDKELFSVIIQEKIKSLSLTQGSKDLLQIWCDFILDCSFAYDRCNNI